MNDAIKKAKAKDRRDTAAYLYIIAGVFALMLVMRDCYSIPISKYIFLILTAVAVMALDIRKVLCLICFLMPLYVGLPGNYISIIFVLRFLCEYKKIRFTHTRLLSALAICAFMFVQNVVMYSTSVYNMIFIVEVFLILLIFSYSGDYDKKNMLFMFALGVASTGFIMLVSTLQEHGLSDLLLSTARLGTNAVTYGETNAMKVNVDPNYYGLFTLASLSICFPMFFDRYFSKTKKFYLLIALTTSLFVCLIGLSRAFVLVLALWSALIIVTQKGPKSFVKTALVIGLAVVLIQVLLPDITQGLLTRFAENDMETGNGRLTIISRFYGLWSTNLITIFLGVGMFACNVHCMQLQYLFGGGIVFSIFILMFAVALISPLKRKYNKICFQSYIPMITVFLMSATVPIATSLTFMFPCILTIVEFDYINEVRVERVPTMSDKRRVNK